MSGKMLSGQFFPGSDAKYVFTLRKDSLLAPPPLSVFSVCFPASASKDLPATVEVASERQDVQEPPGQRGPRKPDTSAALPAGLLLVLQLQVDSPLTPLKMLPIALMWGCSAAPHNMAVPDEVLRHARK